ncbi:MAG: hypothetical protein IJY94_00465 [Clostridia bacterium]|nr:hypothetical protein [Clostridia bacterium]
MTWEIFLGIVALVGFTGTVGTWISKLSKTLGILENTIGILNRTIDEFKRSSHTTHEKLFERLTKDEKTIENHEGRIKNLENERRK